MSEEEVHYRLRQISLMFELFTSLSLGPFEALVLPLPSSRPSIERIQVNELSSQFKNFLKIATTLIENSDKIVLTDKKIEQLDLLGQQGIRGSRTINEAILHLPGGNGLTDVVAIMIFVAFINWLNEANAFQAHLPPHLDPIGWIQGFYNQPKPDPSSSFSKPGYPSTSRQMQRPSAVPHPKYVKMTKEQRRNFSDERDGFITVEDHRQLVVRYDEVEFKTPDHGSVHGLPMNEQD